MTEQSESLLQVRQLGIAYANSESFTQAGSLKIYCRPCQTVEQLYTKVQRVLSKLKSVCFVNFQLAYILKSLESGRHTLFYAGTNTCLFLEQFKLAREADKQECMQKLRAVDFENFFNYPKSGFIAVELSYVRIVVVADTDLPLGTYCRHNLKNLPSNVLENPFIISLFPNTNRKVIVGKVQKKVAAEQCNNLCVFHCLSLHFRKMQKCQQLRDGTNTTPYQLFMRYCSERNINIKNFQGVFLHDFDSLEKIFDVRINVYIYEGSRGGNSIKASQQRLSTLPAAEHGTCNLLRIKQHVVFVRDLYRSMGFLCCDICGDHVKHSNNFRRHVKLCAKRAQTGLMGQPTKVYHSAQQFLPKMNLFEQILYFCGRENFPDLSIFEMHYLCTWDCETIYEVLNPAPSRGKGTVTVAKLKLLVAGVCSNIPGFQEPKLFWYSETFGDDFIDYLIQMSEKQVELLEEQLADVFDLLEQKRQLAVEVGRKDTEKIFTNLYNRLCKFIKPVLAISFNGSRFDGKLVREYIFPAIVKRYKNNPKIIRTMMKENAYIKISCPNINFIDQCNYLPGKSSYDDFLFTVLGQRSKSLFPYEYLQKMDQLLESQLPEAKHWYSQLKNCNLLDVEYQTFSNKLAASKPGTSPEEVCHSLGFSSIPKKGEERLQELRVEFKASGCQNLKDWLAKYLVLDIKPFVVACERLSRAFYRQFGRLLYRYPSIPALGVTVAFRDYMNKAGVEVYVPSQFTYEAILEKVPGGASILFSLEAVAGKTKIREQEFGSQARLCQSIFSLDANLLYGHTMRTLPVGIERIRKASNGFRPELAEKKYKHMFNAERILSFYRHKYKLRNFRTNLRCGERRALFTEAKYSMDGVGDFYDCQGNYVCRYILEVAGHKGHWCEVCQPNEGNEPHICRKHKDGRPMLNWEVKNADRWRLEKLREEEFSTQDIIQEISMCRFNRDYTKPSGSRHNEYQDFLRCCPQYAVDMGVKTEQEILDMIQCGALTGFIIADFESGPTLEKICDMFPLMFKRAYVGREDVGEPMASYLAANGLLKEPKLELISSHFGKELLINTELCKWYLDMGVHVTNVQCVIEYCLTDALSPFVDKVCEMRYAASRADASAEEKMVGQMMKALCVSCYGRMLYNPAKMVNVRYMNNRGLLRAVYREKIVTMDYVGKLEGKQDHLYEMRCRPRVINYASPVHCSAWILNQAKLRILQLAYNVLWQHFQPQCYSFFCTQTDSLSLVCSEASLEDFLKNCLIPGQEESFAAIRDEYFVNPADPMSKFRDGVFKKEWSGVVALGCSSKVYCIFDENHKVAKLACRSLPHSAAKHLTIDDFRKVLYEHEPIIVKYRSFNYILGEILCDELKKCVVTAYYIKRKVNRDLTTSTLNV